MKLFPFQEAFKSGSSVCPHRKFLCFNFPKKEISLRSEPSICLWTGLFQETWQPHPQNTPGFLLLLGPRDKQLIPGPVGGDPTKAPILWRAWPLSLPVRPEELKSSRRDWVPVIQSIHMTERPHTERHTHTHIHTQRHPKVVPGSHTKIFDFCHKENSISNDHGTQKQNGKWPSAMLITREPSTPGDRIFHTTFPREDSKWDTERGKYFQPQSYKN